MTFVIFLKNQQIFLFLLYFKVITRYVINTPTICSTIDSHVNMLESILKPLKINNPIITPIIWLLFIIFMPLFNFLKTDYKLLSRMFLLIHTDLQS